ncbi:Uncharacterized protein SAPIO_CDS4873 [Scedosporium apiospermum]|uniref:BHLH domain-containing protein n=1 Tax=Pseudallescheria apiosperma TaxID=563466 RepID=A0A084G788_PSEDA|nr:Uncharacterized protein SAPIO_CDS4873 [Scedosporium apiospermum]KEZ43200.1 Uncharacterized protein SAPIO_CDS4873 [Scedosporium apiospermum]
MATRTMDFYYPTQRDSISADFTDLALYDPQQADFNTDSAAPSPVSPTFPVLTNAYQLPQAADWINWSGKAALSPEFPSTDSFDSPILSARFPTSTSPAVNPLDLAKRETDTIAFVDGSFDDLQTPLFDNIDTAPANPISSKSRKIKASSTAATRNNVLEALSPTTTDEGRYPSRKRKSLASASETSSSSARSSLAPPSPPLAPVTSRRTSGGSSSTTERGQPKKTAHNMIEKRYRNNLNDKIAALRDAVPSLRVAAYRLENGQTPEDAELEDDVTSELGGLAPAQKLNKATILSKAAEYILHLERKNKELADENALLKRRAGDVDAATGGLDGLWR